MPKLTKTVVDQAIPKSTRYAIWDTEIKGLGVYISPNGSKSYYLKYRTGNGVARKPKIGEHGSITLVQARKIASEWINEVCRGGDPSRIRQEGRSAIIMKELAKRYVDDYAKPYKKPSSVRMDEINLQNHVLPAFGTRKIADIYHIDIAKLHQSIGKEFPGAANRVIALLSKMFNLAEKWGLRTGVNPCRHIVKFKENKIERYLTSEQYQQLFQAIDTSILSRTIEPLAGIAIQLIALTGCRVGEITSLRWEDFEQRSQELVLRDSKTGGHRFPLGEDAVGILKSLWQQRLVNDLGWIFPQPGERDRPMKYFWLRTRWYKIRTLAELPTFRMHDLRHGFASIAASEGFSLQMIGGLLGHKHPATTARYAHLIVGPLHAAAKKINSKISESMMQNKTA